MQKVFREKKELQNYLDRLRLSGKNIGFIPTMGALHKGHLSLISCSSAENDATICSIFVNPTQFNEDADFERYPRNLEKDIKLLENTECDIIFAPETNEVYEEGNRDLIKIDLGLIDKDLEGNFRPGHFDGVITVVKKLFDIVQPNKAYFGQKDFQQYLAIKKLVEFFNLPIQLVRCPIIREFDGLAMSSRNVLLTKEERAFAPRIYEALESAQNMLKNKSVQEIKEWAKNFLCSSSLVGFEYFEIRNGENLEPVNFINEADEIVIVTAIRVGKIRLIDNLLVKMK